MSQNDLVLSHSAVVFFHDLNYGQKVPQVPSSQNFRKRYYINIFGPKISPVRPKGNKKDSRKKKKKKQWHLPERGRSQYNGGKKKKKKCFGNRLDQSKRKKYTFGEVK